MFQHFWILLEHHHFDSTNDDFSTENHSCVRALPLFGIFNAVSPRIPADAS